MLLLPVSATVRHESTPAIGYAARLTDGSSLSISSEIVRKRSAMPLIFVTWTVLPQVSGSQVIDSRFCRKRDELQSPYILSKKAWFRKRPGSKFSAGSCAILPGG